MTDESEKSWFARQRDNYEALLAEYGMIALGVYLTIFIGTVTAFYVAIQMGWSADGASAEAGKIGAAYLASKALQPVRIVATIAITPVVAKVKHRFWPASATNND